jgi:uncharacterized protein (DUF433 family)
MGGKTCIRGMRLTVSLIVNLVADGMTPAEIIEEYPELEPADIQQAVAYAAWLAEEAVHPLDVWDSLSAVLGTSPRMTPEGGLPDQNGFSPGLRGLRHSHMWR